MQVPEASRALLKSHKITIPYPDPKPEKSAAYKLSYEKPSNVNVVGSYASKTMVKSDGVLSVDMVVVMPASIFQEKDYLNYRYFYKRAYYLACVAAGLHDSTQKEMSLSFEYLNGNTLQPILVARPISGTLTFRLPRAFANRTQESRVQKQSIKYALFLQLLHRFSTNRNYSLVRMLFDQKMLRRTKVLPSYLRRSTTLHSLPTVASSHI